MAEGRAAAVTYANDNDDPLGLLRSLTLAVPFCLAVWVLLFWWLV